VETCSNWIVGAGASDGALATGTLQARASNKTAGISKPTNFSLSIFKKTITPHPNPEIAVMFS
jgi:hypothetical protein